MSENENEIFLLLLNEENPMPRLHELRATDPVHFVESLGFWFATRHDDIKRLLNDTDNVTHDKRAWNFYGAPAEGSMRRWHEDHGIFAVGKEDHARIRRLVSLAFSPRAVLRMEQQIREVIDRVATPLRGRYGEVIDLLGDFTNVIPNAVISRITGVPQGEDEARFCKIAQSVIQGFLPFSPEEIQAELEENFQELSKWVRVMVASRRDNLQEDLVSDLIRAQDANDTLSEDDIVLLLAVILGAGSEATAQIATAVVRVLLNEPAVVERLREDRSLIRRSMDEILRYSFTQPAGTMRFAVRDFELRGKTIEKGQMIMLSGAGANRDPSVFENPDVFDLDRRNAREGLVFGYGPHFCLGAHLAREEIATMIDAVLDILPSGSHVRTDAIEYRDMMGLFKQAANLPVQVSYT